MRGSLTTAKTIFQSLLHKDGEVKRREELVLTASDGTQVPVYISVNRMVRDEAHKRDGTSWTDEEREAYRAPVRKTFEDFANAYNYARHTWCDMVIDPLETRNVMALLLDLAGRLPPQETEFGVFRM